MKTLLRRSNDLLAKTNKFEQALLMLASIGVVLGGFALLRVAYLSMTYIVPAKGGSLTEGVLGTPRFINPALAASSADLDTTRLVYSGLLRQADFGVYTPDLAKSCTYSKSGTEIECEIKKTARFHDRKPVTADDIVFTFDLISQLGSRSPQWQNTSGVIVTKIGTNKVKFTLKKSFSGFERVLTLGILPKHLWGGISTDSIESSTNNVYPIGSGPYKIAGVSTKDSQITKIKLTAFNHVALGRPYINTITLEFFEDTEKLMRALSGNAVDAGVVPKNENHTAISNASMHLLVSSDLYSIFFQPTKNKQLENRRVQEVIRGIDRVSLLKSTDTVAVPWDKHLISNDFTFSSKSASIVTLVDTAQEQSDPIKIATVNNPVLIRIAERIEHYLAENSIQSDTQIYEFGEFKTSVIPNRQFEVLLFGQQYRHPTDAYSFWHTSQRIDPGLNVLGHANKNSDKLLESLLSETDSAKRAETYIRLEHQIASNQFFVPLYRDAYYYVLPAKLYGAKMILSATDPADRFNGIYQYALLTKRSIRTDVFNSH